MLTVGSFNQSGCWLSLELLICIHASSCMNAGVLDLKPWVLGCHLFDLPRLSFVQQLLWKGLLHERTCMVTVQVLTSILWQLEACLSPHRSSSGVTTFQAGIKDVAAGAGLASPAAEGMGRIMGQCSYQLVACLVSGLPWVLAHRHESESRNQVCLACVPVHGRYKSMCYDLIGKEFSVI